MTITNFHKLQNTRHECKNYASSARVMHSKDGSARVYICNEQDKRYSILSLTDEERKQLIADLSK